MLREPAGWATRRGDRVEAWPCVRAPELRRIGVLAPDPDQEMVGVLAPDHDREMSGAVPYADGITALYDSEDAKLSLYEMGHADGFLLVEWADCNLGGTRPFFVCPGCGKRRLAVYRVREKWACRTCHGLKYQSQRLSRADRAQLRAERIRAKYPGANPRPLNPLPAKPKNMRWSEYHHDSVALQEADLASLDVGVRGLRALGINQLPDLELHAIVAKRRKLVDALYPKKRVKTR